MAALKADVLPATELPAETLQVLRLMIGQVPIIMAVRAGGELRIPATEMDRAGEWKMTVNIEGGDIVFKVSPADRKH